MNIFISLSKKEASETAIEYGKICSIICPIINLVLENTKPKEYNVKIFPDFNKTKTSIDADFNFNISLTHYIILVKYNNHLQCYYKTSLTY